MTLVNLSLFLVCKIGITIPLRGPGSRCETTPSRGLGTHEHPHRLSLLLLVSVIIGVTVAFANLNTFEVTGISIRL